MKRRKFLIFSAVAAVSLAGVNLNARDKNMKILVLGASGSLGRYVIDALLSDENVNLRLFSRNLSKIEKYKSERVEIYEGDALDATALEAALDGADAVYAGLAGELEAMANALVAAMNKKGVKRVVWITSYNIYGEASGWAPPREYGASAAIIEASNLDYTLIRPQWFSSVDEVDYEITHRHEKFKNSDAQISRRSIADLVRRCLLENFGVRDSLGINKPAK